MIRPEEYPTAVDVPDWVWGAGVVAAGLVGAAVLAGVVVGVSERVSRGEYVAALERASRLVHPRYPDARLWPLGRSVAVSRYRRGDPGGVPWSGQQLAEIAHMLYPRGYETRLAFEGDRTWISISPRRGKRSDQQEQDEDA